MRYFLPILAALGLALPASAAQPTANTPISGMSIATTLQTNAWIPIIQPLPGRTTNDNFRVHPSVFAAYMSTNGASTNVYNVLITTNLYVDSLYITTNTFLVEVGVTNYLGLWVLSNSVITPWSAKYPVALKNTLYLTTGLSNAIYASTNDIVYAFTGGNDAHLIVKQASNYWAVFGADGSNVVINANPGGDILFQSNNVTIGKIAVDSGYSGTGTNVLGDDGLYHPYSSLDLWTNSAGVYMPAQAYSQVDATNITGYNVLRADAAFIMSPVGGGATLSAGTNQMFVGGTSRLLFGGYSTNAADSSVRLDVGRGPGQFLVLQNYGTNAWTLYNGDELWDQPTSHLYLKGGDWMPSHDGESILLYADWRGWAEIGRYGGPTNVVVREIVMNPTTNYVPYKIADNAFGDSWLSVNGDDMDFNGTNVAHYINVKNSTNQLAMGIAGAGALVQGGDTLNVLNAGSDGWSIQTNKVTLGIDSTNRFDFDVTGADTIPRLTFYPTANSSAALVSSNGFILTETVSGYQWQFDGLSWGPRQVGSLLASSAWPLSGLYTHNVIWGDGGPNPNAVADTFGPNSPEGVLSASVGSVYRQTNGTPGSVVWVKETGFGNTGWTALGASTTINSLDGYLPVRGSATTFTNSWLYNTANGVATDTNIFFGPGTTNVLSRSGNNLVYTNGGNTAKFQVDNGTGVQSWMGSDAAGLFLGTTGISSSWGVSGQTLYNTAAFMALYPDTDNATDLGTFQYNMKALHARTNFVYGYHHATLATNYSRLAISHTGTNGAVVLDSQSSGIAGDPRPINLQIGGTNSLRLFAKNWKDSMIPQTAIRLGSTAPTLTAFGPGGVASVYQFDNNQDDEVQFSIQLNHDYKQGSDIALHVHSAEMAATGAGTNYVLELAYSWANVNEAFPAYATNLVTNAISGTLWYHKLNEFTHISKANSTVSSIIMCRLRRLANSATADDYDQGIGLLSVDAHYEADSIGSDEENTKTP